LLPPVEQGGQRLQLTQLNRVTTCVRGEQEQNRLLDIGSQQPQVQDLGNPRTRHVTQRRQGGVVGHGTGLNQLLQA
jgi:hypothetical protein